ncbi:hypothetical protein, partial [Nostoc sp. 106C]|uniref:hypothetical protein n=1 Tax=Nostoc sp. 106C TaxID=1932667 RepID=UPI001AA13A1F
HFFTTSLRWRNAFPQGTKRSAVKQSQNLSLRTNLCDCYPTLRERLRRTGRLRLRRTSSLRDATR